MEYAVSRWGYMASAKLAGIYFTIGYSVMCSYPIALLAEYALRITEFQEYIKALIIGRKLLVKFFDCKLCSSHIAPLVNKYV
jgi:hypothetical protein